MATVAIVFRKDKINKKGECPIHFRITKNRRPVYIASGVKIPKNQWDEKRQKVKISHKNSARLNFFLSTKYTEIYNSVLENETLPNYLTSRKLRENAFGKAPQNYFLFADKVVAYYRKAGQIGSYYKNLAIIAKLREYCKNEQITFHEITAEFLVKYEGYLKSKLGNKTNTVHKDMKFHRKVFNDAIRQDVIGLELSPFRKYQMRLEKTHRDYLTEEELAWIERFPATPGSRLELHKNMFIFASYTGGLRISDVLKLQWKDFDGSHLHLVIRKTRIQVSIKVPNKGLEIIQRLKKYKEDHESFIFPMLENGLDLKNPETTEAAIKKATAYINKNLRIIAESVGIKKNLSFHVSRHSFAVRALRKGISIDKVSKLMGHAAIKETQIYAKVVNQDLDNAMDLFNH